MRGNAILTRQGTEMSDKNQAKSVTIADVVEVLRFDLNDAKKRVAEIEAQISAVERMAERVTNMSRVEYLDRLTADDVTPTPAAADQPQPDDDRPTILEAAAELINSAPNRVFRLSEVTKALAGKVYSNAKNFNGAVSASLSNLVKAGRISKARRAGYTAIGSPHAVNNPFSPTKPPESTLDGESPVSSIDSFVDRAT